jgi:hypothetical protein
VLLLLQMFHKRPMAAAAGVAGSSSSATSVLDLQQDVYYKHIHDKCAALYKVQPNKPLPPGLDPQDNSEQATFTFDELYKIADALLGSEDPKDTRDLSMLLWMCQTCGRGDDARPRRICELTEPKLRCSIGECDIVQPYVDEWCSAAISLTSTRALSCQHVS